MVRDAELYAASCRSNALQCFSYIKADYVSEISVMSDIPRYILRIPTVHVATSGPLGLAGERLGEDVSNLILRTHMVEFCNLCESSGAAEYR